MNKLITLAAAGCLAVAPSALANDSGRTICVLRHRPAAIQPAPRAPLASLIRSARPSEEAQFSARINSYYGYVPGRLNTRFFPALRVPAIYGMINPRLHYVSPILRNGYIGGMRNLPTNVVQIPPKFGRPGFHTLHSFHHHRGHHAGHTGGAAHRPGGNAPHTGGGRPAGTGAGRGR